MSYQTIKTQAGLGLEAAADAGGPAVKLIAMSVGDGNGQAVSVSTTQTGLVHEVDRVNLNQLRQNPNDATQWVAEAVFPADHGGYTVREVGLWTDAGVLFAVASFPETYKPAPSEGTAGQLIIELNFRAANSDNVTLVVDGNLQLATQEWVEKNYVSGTYGMGGGDSAGLGLHTNGSTGKPVYLDKTGARDLALAADVQGVLSGTAGLAPGDTAGVGLHLNHGTGRATFGTAGGDWKDLAWSADVDNLSQQVHERLQAAVSGTYWMGAGDSPGLGLHTNGSTGKPVYLDKTGARDLALAADVQGVLSGTAGMAPGDTSGVGLHVNHASDRPTFGDDTGRWRDLALATDLDSRLPVSSPAASGSLTVNNSGAVMSINPNTSFNGQLRGQITWGTRSWYPGGDGLIMRDNGNLLADGTRQTSIQRFTTQGSHGQRIQFPQQFKSDDVQVMVMSMDSGGNYFHTVDRFTVDIYGFALSINSWNGTGYGIEQRQTVIDVVAFGEM
ncbi:MAG: phage tail protein [Bombella apis]|uniref:phage tail protein n=1 Tax=Bombella apis TaxID=1785988 RepID=UPI0023F1DAC9|nr:phage tail protein [Bombella apis]MCT6819491.1 phage tail protein [Bombella apis]